MQKIIFLFLIVAVLGSMTACKRTLPDSGRSAVVKMANNWWATQVGSASGPWTNGPAFFVTYNSSSNSIDSLWLDDLENGIGIKTEVTANYPKLTFSSTLSFNQYLSDSVTVFNAKVIPLGGHSKTGVAVDSLYLQALFSDDPGDTITIAGTARSGLIDDDY